MEQSPHTSQSTCTRVYAKAHEDSWAHDRHDVPQQISASQRLIASGLARKKILLCPVDAVDARRLHLLAITPRLSATGDMADSNIFKSDPKGRKKKNSKRHKETKEVKKGQKRPADPKE